MGCFSFKCKECDAGVNSSSFEGEMVKLFLLKNGKIIQQMEGEYDSYGQVFIDDTQRGDVKHPLRKAAQWKNPNPDVPFDESDTRMGKEHAIWLRVCDLMHDSKDRSNGIAAIHSKCFKKEPNTRSERDPNQGWGKIKKKHKRVVQK